MNDNSLLGFGFNSSGASVVVPTKALVPFVVGGSINSGWAADAVLLMPLGINGNLISGGLGGINYTSDAHDDFRFYLINTSNIYSGQLRYNLQVTLTGSITANRCRVVLGKATAVAGNTSYTFTYTKSSQHVVRNVTDQAAYLTGTIPYTAAANDILIFGLVNDSAVTAINNSVVHISGLITLESTLA
jgi:hypothetical protein